MSTTSTSNQNIALWLVNKKNWLTHFMIVSAICIAGLIYLGGATYMGSPPLEDYVSASTGETVISRTQIKRGQELFHIRGLMGYGSFWGDGAERGPDFSADALHRTVMGMRSFYAQELADSGIAPTEYDAGAIAARVRGEVHENYYDEVAGVIRINDAQISAFSDVVDHYTAMFNDPTYSEAFEPSGFISDPDDLEALSAFFFWGGWVSAANRPGETYSYTHNWPNDPDAGNSPTAATFFWSVFSIFALFVGVMLVLYVYGQMREQDVDVFDTTSGNENNGQSLTTYDLENEYVRPTQRATYKFFVLAMIVFLVQIIGGVLAATDFVRPFGVSMNDIIPFTVARSYHTLLQIFWFFMCWVGYTIFFLPRISKVPPGQKTLINLLFVLCIVTGGGALAGIYMGQTGMLSDSAAYWFGSQGWEFMELGRFFQFTLLAAFALWIFIIYRAVRPWLTKRNLWSVPSWLLYGSGIMVMFLFFGLMVQPDMNFAISDYWRWMVVHMWVEVTFEVFTTVIVGYMLVQMGLITRMMAERVIFLAVMLFLITATIGISHNFYWIAKPTGIIALGSVFSTLQVLPLLLLTLDAWQMRQEGHTATQNMMEGKQTIVMEGVWLFILGVNFWNIFGAGVLGSVINLPIVNYYEHATYLTGNHAHAAMFGVKGNIALGGMLFCCQHLFHKAAWNPKLVRTSFWSLNIGLALMMFLDLFPVGLYQTWIAYTEGTWYARSSEIVTGPVFSFLTYCRTIGGMVFIWGGLVPMVWFILSRGTKLRLKEEDVAEGEWTVYEQAWSEQNDPSLGG